MAIDYPGTTAFYISGTIPSIDVPLTLSVWFDPDQGNSNQTLVNVGAGLVGERVSQAQRLQITNTQTLQAVSSATNGNNNSASTTLYNVNQWNHGAGVFASNTARQVWLNGVTGPTGQQNRASGVCDSLNIGQGSGGTYSPAQAFNGQLAEVAVWNVALTNDEIISLSKGVKPTSIRPQSLIYYFPLIRDVIEIRSGITFINTTTTPVDHPRRYG